MSETRAVTVVKVLLTVTALEFFGPLLRDFSDSHAWNPTWVGHARLHLVWLLGFLFFSGLANLYLIWLRRPFEVRNLWLSAGWQSCNMAGFWAAIFLVPVYDGLIAVPGIHVAIFGFDENIFGFSVLTALLAAAILILHFRVR